MAKLRWREAITTALYGPAGFYRTGAGPQAHFRTSSRQPQFAAALATLVRHVDEALEQPRQLAVVDVGAGRGELLCGLRAQLADNSRIRFIGVEVAQRPPELPAEIYWRSTLPSSITGVIIANEWLDNITFDIAVGPADRPRYLLVDPATGEEGRGDPVTATDHAWLSRWWPLLSGQRAEIGVKRDAAWAKTMTALAAGAALTIDYAHQKRQRPPGGSMLGYRHGIAVPPIPDGSCDITAHVALDAVAAAGEAVGATGTVLTSQREALRQLGLSTLLPPYELGRHDPPKYLRELAEASAAAELTDPHGLGGFAWLLQTKGIEPAAIW